MKNSFYRNTVDGLGWYVHGLAVRDLMYILFYSARMRALGQDLDAERLYTTIELS